MELDRRQLYFNAVIGGLGGLLGWTGAVLVQAILPNDANVYVLDALLGLFIGAAIGAAIGSIDGLIVSRSRQRLLNGLAYGAAIGAGGGIVGLVLGEVLFGIFGGGLLPRAMGWAIFGGLVGTCDGVARRMPARIRYGVIGGVLGGFIGGATYERLAGVLIWATDDRSLALAWGGAIGLILVGACIGFLIGLVESLLRTAWLTFLSGRLEGQNRTIDSGRDRTTIGSSDICTIIVLGDKSVAPIHAEIVPVNGQYVIRSVEGDLTVDRAGQVFASPSQELAPGDRIQLGATKMIFRAEEAKSS